MLLDHRIYWFFSQIYKKIQVCIILYLRYDKGFPLWLLEPDSWYHHFWYSSLSIFQGLTLISPFDSKKNNLIVILVQVLIKIATNYKKIEIRWKILTFSSGEKCMASMCRNSSGSSTRSWGYTWFNFTFIGYPSTQDSL